MLITHVAGATDEAFRVVAEDGIRAVGKGVGDRGLCMQSSRVGTTMKAAKSCNKRTARDMISIYALCICNLKTHVLVLFLLAVLSSIPNDHNQFA